MRAMIYERAGSQRKRCILISGMLLLTLNALQAQANLPEPIRDGLEALSRGGYALALEHWTRNWTSADDEAKRQTLDSAFAELVVLADQPIGYEIVRVAGVSPRLVRVYALVLHRRQPVYVILVGYRAEAAWSVTNITFHTVAERVFPVDLLVTERP